MRHALAQRNAATSAAELVEADLKFHTAVVAAAHNNVLVEVFGSFLGALRNAAEDIVADSTLRTPDEDTAVEAAHHALVDAIADGDTDAAVVATRRNVHATLVRLRGET